MKTKRFLLVLLLAVILINTGFSIRMPSFTMPEASVLYDVNGKVISGLAEKNGVNVSLEEISPYFTAAVIAVEDKNFRSASRYRCLGHRTGHLHKYQESAYC